MTLHKPVRRNYSGKLPVGIKYQNLYSFREEVILLCQSILEMKRISHLHGSPLFTIPLTLLINLTFSEGIFPSILKAGKIFPMHKK